MDVNAESSPLQPANRDGGIDQGFGRIDAQSDRCRSRGQAYGPERLGGTVRPGVVPVIDSFRVHALSPQASLAYPSGPVRGTGRSESQRRHADTRGCTLDSAAHVKPEHAAGAARPWLSVESRRVRALQKRGTCGPRTGAEKATDGAGRSGYADRSHPDSRSDLPFQDVCSMSPSPSSPRSCSVSRVPRASAMRWLAAVAWPSMQWA